MEKAFKGSIDKDGNFKLRDAKAFKSFLEQHKSTDMIVSIHLADSPASKFSINYFMHIICLEYIQIFKIHLNEFTTKEKISYTLRSWTPVCIKDNEVLELEDLSQEQLNELIRNSKYIASKEFDYFISD